ncbi:unnamed protein product [Bursaphelenchus xylophilus]|uniref:(pine wood nematode) hypothetical protein n=1 Tax=Bursaphelenchus xylophilus TaxID=6326 RepID=A0A1I7S2K3_BURXY|nr:unnamed protein product [Bursaphelenchus xylophilus]CAG9121891.1 unnamed protein product [Bursaphelenchus xylophilus]
MEDYTTTKAPLSPVQDEPSASHTAMVGVLNALCSLLAYLCPTGSCVVNGKVYFNMCHVYSLIGIFIALVFLGALALFVVIIRDQMLLEIIRDVHAVVFSSKRPSKQVFELEQIESPSFENFQRPKFQSTRRRKVMPGGDFAAYEFL